MINAIGNIIGSSGQSEVAVNAGDNQSINAGETVQLTGSGPIGSIWSTSGTGTFNDSTNLNAIYTPSLADIDSETIILNLTNGETSDMVTITIEWDFSTQYQAVITYAEGNAITVPPLSILWQDDLKVRDSVADGSWADEDLVYYMRDRDGYRNYAKLNWKNPGTFTLTEVGTLSFDNNGFTGNGTTGYLRTGFIPSTHAVKYTLDNASVRTHSITQLDNSDNLYGCNTTSSARRLILVPRSGGNCAYVINSTTSKSFANTNSYGFAHLKRTASNALSLWKDGAQADTATVASTSLPNTEIYILCTNNNGTPAGFSPRNIGVFLLGASQNGKEISNNAIWNPSYWDQSLAFTPTNTFFLEMGGQSNSEGQSPISELSSPLKRKFSNVYIWNNSTETLTGGRWEKLQVGLNNQRSSRLSLKTYGAEIVIADLFERNHPNDVLYISKYSVGGANIAQVAGSDWNSESVGEALDIALDNYHVPARAAISQTPITDKGLLWMQGEADAFSTYYASFKTNTLSMFSEYRTKRSSSNLPIYVCRINSAIDRESTYLNGIRTNQGVASGEICDASTYPNNHFFDTDNYPLISGDTVHFEQQPFGEDLYNEIF